MSDNDWIDVPEVRKTKVYVASSWKNVLHPGIVHILRRLGYEVYDYRHPDGPGSDGFNWRSIDDNWRTWSVEQYRSALHHPIAVEGYKKDMTGIQECDVIVLVMPSGRSACWELGAAMAMGKTAFILSLEPMEPDLMFAEARILASIEEFLDEFERTRFPRAPSIRFPTR